MECSSDAASASFWEPTLGRPSGSTQLQLCSLLSCAFAVCAPMPSETEMSQTQNTWRVAQRMLRVDPHERLSMQSQADPGRLGLTVCHACQNGL